MTIEFGMETNSLAGEKFDFLGEDHRDRSRSLTDQPGNSWIHLVLDDIRWMTLLSPSEADVPPAGISTRKSRNERKLLREFQPDRFEDITRLLRSIVRGPSISFRSSFSGKRAISPRTLRPWNRFSVLPVGDCLSGTGRWPLPTAWLGFIEPSRHFSRRAMGEETGEEMRALHYTVCGRAVGTGTDREATEHLFQMITGILCATIGQQKSHAAAYALYSPIGRLSPATHYRWPSLTALLTGDIGDRERLSLYAGRCRELGVGILPNINRGGVD